MITINMQFDTFKEASEVFRRLAASPGIPIAPAAEVEERPEPLPRAEPAQGPAEPAPEPEAPVAEETPAPAATDTVAPEPEEDETGPADAGEVNAYRTAIELAAEKGVDLTEVKGCGKNGKITKGDVQKVITARERAARDEKMRKVAEEMEAGASPQAASHELSESDCREALSELAKAKDFKTCAQVLGEFDASRISDLKPQQFTEFCKRCRELSGE